MVRRIRRVDRKSGKVPPRMENPKPTFSYFVSQAKEKFPDLAYLHVIEPPVGGEGQNADNMESNKFLRKIWGDKVFIAAGGFTPQTALETVNTDGGLIAFGCLYIANPDLPLRVKDDVPLTKYQHSTAEDPHGYIDYPTANPQLTGALATVPPNVEPIAA